MRTIENGVPRDWTPEETENWRKTVVLGLKENADENEIQEAELKHALPKTVSRANFIAENRDALIDELARGVVGPARDTLSKLES